MGQFFDPAPRGRHYRCPVRNAAGMRCRSSVQHEGEHRYSMPEHPALIAMQEAPRPIVGLRQAREMVEFE